MARWKARVKFLLSAIELLFLSLTVEALQGKMCQNSLPSGEGRSLAAKISGERDVTLPIYWYHSKGSNQLPFEWYQYIGRAMTLSWLHLEPWFYVKIKLC